MAAVFPHRLSQVERQSQVKLCVRDRCTHEDEATEQLCM